MKLSSCSFLIDVDIINDAEIELTHYSSSKHLNSITFALNEDNLKKSIDNTNISAIITTQELANEINIEKGLVISKNPKKDFFNIHNWMFKNNIMRLNFNPSISKTARISEHAVLAKNVIIGENVEIAPYAIIEEYSVIGDYTYIGPHVVVGARGMHNTKIDGEFINVVDAGGVKIGKNCEILAGATIQKSYFREFTGIGDYTKISLKTNISHGCCIGERTLIASNSNVAGFSIVGDDVWIGPSSTIAHGVIIGDKAEIKLGSVVITNVKEKENISGNFAYSHKKNLINFLKNKR